MSRHDIVSVVRVVDDTRLWVDRTIEPSGHWTIRGLPTNPSELEEVANEFGMVTTWDADPADVCKYFLHAAGGGRANLLALISCHPEVQAILEEEAQG